MKTVLVQFLLSISDQRNPVTHDVTRRTPDALGQLRYLICGRICRQHKSRTHHQQQAHTCSSPHCEGFPMHEHFSISSAPTVMDRPCRQNDVSIASHLWSIIQGRGTVCGMNITSTSPQIKIIFNMEISREKEDPLGSVPKCDGGLQMRLTSCGT